MPLLSSKTENKNGKELPVYDHLLELRVRLLWSLGVIIFFAVLSSFFSNNILGIIKNAGGLPGKLVYFSPYEGFLIYFKISLFSGLVLASPVIFYHLWMFISPGLYEREKKFILPFVFLSSIFFISGVIFSFFTGIPFITKFLLKFGSDIRLSPKLSVDSYLDFILSTGLTFGLVFEWPILIFFLAKMKIISTFALIKKRKHALLVSFIIAGVITPPDIISLFSLGIPIYSLYEIGILLARIFAK
ncbi:MAG: twin-arginine translocase subunit TatC [bacterium]|nr:twin-arginine translocase subunit TatC [bacterium]